MAEMVDVVYERHHIIEMSSSLYALLSIKSQLCQMNIISGGWGGGNHNFHTIDVQDIWC